MPTKGIWYPCYWRIVGDQFPTLGGGFFHGNLRFLPPWPKAGKTQRKEIEGKGSMGDMSFALFRPFANRLYIGASFNISVLACQQTSFYSEEDAGRLHSRFCQLYHQRNISVHAEAASAVNSASSCPRIYPFGGGHPYHLYSLTGNYTTDFTANFDGGGSTSALSPLGAYK